MLFQHYYYMASFSPLYEGDDNKTYNFIKTIQKDKWLPWNSLNKIKRSISSNGILLPDNLQKYFSKFQSERILYNYLQWI